MFEYSRGKNQHKSSPLPFQYFFWPIKEKKNITFSFNTQCLGTGDIDLNYMKPGLDKYFALADSGFLCSNMLELPQAFHWNTHTAAQGAVIQHRPLQCVCVCVVEGQGHFLMSFPVSKMPLMP